MNTIYISKLGNTIGPNPDRENSPSYIREALDQGFQVLINIKYDSENNKFILEGYPEVDTNIFLENKNIWFNIKQETGKYLDYEDKPYDGELLQGSEKICSDYIRWYRQAHRATYKIALCISGRLTTHRQNLNPQIIKYLTEHPTHWIDVWMSLNYNNPVPYTELDPPFIRKIVCKKFIMPTDTLKYKPKPYTCHAPLFNILSCFYHRREVIKMVPEDVDCVIRYRPDIVYPSLPDLSIMEPNTLFIPSGKDHTGISDLISFGDFQTIKKLSQLDPDDYLDFNYHPESLIDYHIKRHNIKVIRYPGDDIGVDLNRLQDNFS